MEMDKRTTTVGKRVALGWMRHQSVSSPRAWNATIRNKFHWVEALLALEIKTAIVITIVSFRVGACARNTARYLHMSSSDLSQNHEGVSHTSKLDKRSRPHRRQVPRGL